MEKAKEDMGLTGFKTFFIPLVSSEAPNVLINGNTIKIFF